MTAHPPGRPSHLPERRSNFELRELVDEFLRNTRYLARHARDLPEAELQDIVGRLEWLSDEIVRITAALTRPS